MYRALVLPVVSAVADIMRCGLGIIVGVVVLIRSHN